MLKMLSTNDIVVELFGEGKCQLLLAMKNVSRQARVEYNDIMDDKPITLIRK